MFCKYHLAYYIRNIYNVFDYKKNEKKLFTQASLNKHKESKKKINKNVFHKYLNKSFGNYLFRSGIFFANKAKAPVLRNFRYHFFCLVSSFLNGIDKFLCD